jgi:hypothetical protein
LTNFASLPSLSRFVTGVDGGEIYRYCRKSEKAHTRGTQEKYKGLMKYKDKAEISGELIFPVQVSTQQVGLAARLYS